LKHLLFQLAPLERPTGATGFGLLLTPKTSEHIEDHARFVERMGDRSMNAFPNLATQIHLLPTPTARDHKSEKASPETMDRNARPLSETFGANTGWKLQPAFVEYMMGYPENWTELND
jgi:hypothetical protein